MRIGDILLHHGWVDDDSLARALADQIDNGQRLCSLLIAHGSLGFDHASRALGEQLSVPAVLHRHLEHRDDSLAALIPAELGRSAMVVPIGRQANGTVIIAARDPSPALAARLGRTIFGPILLAVAPARYVERLVEHSYNPRPVAVAVEREDSAPPAGPPARPTPPPLPRTVTPPPRPVAPAPPPPEPDLDFDIDVEAAVPAPVPAPASEVTAGIPRRASTALPVAIPTQKIARGKSAKGSVEALIESFEDIDDVPWLLDVVMAYVGTRWTHALLLVIDGSIARGQLAVGPGLQDAPPATIEVPLGTPTIVHQAYAQRRLIDLAPPGTGAAQAQLLAQLGGAREPVAAPLQLADQVTHVLVVGDPRGEEAADAEIDLARLVEAIDDARARLS